jgi:hypothetical protein
MTTWSTPKHVGKAPKLYNVRDLEWVAGQMLAGDSAGGLAALEADRWTSIAPSGAAEAAMGPGAGLQSIFVGWGDRLCGLSSSAAVLVFDPDSSTWTTRSGPEPTLNKKVRWGLTAFDPTRQRLVLWGPQKADGKRSDTTVVFDGSGFQTPKKATPVDPADLKESAGAFCVVFHAGLDRVVRVGMRSAAAFDGALWQPLILRGGEHLHDWERRAFIANGRTFLVQRFINDASIVELVADGETLTVKKVLALPSAVTREKHSTGSNVVLDVAGFDPVSASLVAFDDQLLTRSTLDLSSIVR